MIQNESDAKLLSFIILTGPEFSLTFRLAPDGKRPAVPRPFPPPWPDREILRGGVFPFPAKQDIPRWRHRRQ